MNLELLYNDVIISIVFSLHKSPKVIIIHTFCSVFVSIPGSIYVKVFTMLHILRHLITNR
jgi:hypothetical protein